MTKIENKLISTEELMGTLSIRLLMQGKEGGIILGKKGENIKKFREESGAKINISAASCPERIITISGNIEIISSAFKLISKKLEEDISQLNQTDSSLTFRLLIPSSQCGSLIGKGGSKIKDIREETGASIQVASDMMPDSTDRTVTMSGPSEAINQCIYRICGILIESPPTSSTNPYYIKSHTAGGPVIISGGQAYTIQGNYAVPAAPDISKLTTSPLAGLLGLGSISGGNQSVTPTDISALAALAGSQLRTSTNAGLSAQTHEMTVPNELIGCIIGKGGTKIAEIRQITGAMITISKYDDGSEDASKQDRTITIKGNEDQVALAQYLINTSMELHKAQLEVGKSGTAGSIKNPNTIPLAQLLKNPQALTAISSLTGMQGLTSLSSQMTADQTQVLSAAAVIAQSHKAHQLKYRPSASTQMFKNDSPPSDFKHAKLSPY